MRIDRVAEGGIMTMLLLVDDDAVFCQVLGRAFEKRGYDMLIAHDVDRAMALVFE